MIEFLKIKRNPFLNDNLATFTRILINSFEGVNIEVESDKLYVAIYRTVDEKKAVMRYVFNRKEIELELDIIKYINHFIKKLKKDILEVDKNEYR